MSCDLNFLPINENAIAFVAVRQLRRHEQIDLERATALLHTLSDEGTWTVPLLVEQHSNIILDGHHRFWCACQLGLVWVPALQIEYCDPDLTLETWRPDYPVTIDDVLAAAGTGNLMPHKTSRHRLSRPIPGCSHSLVALRARPRSEAA